jgi:hypothetical protein
MTQRPVWLDRSLADCPHIDPAIPDDLDAPWSPPAWLLRLTGAVAFIALAAAIGLAAR